MKKNHLFLIFTPGFARIQKSNTLFFEIGYKGERNNVLKIINTSPI